MRVHRAQVGSVLPQGFTAVALRLQHEQLAQAQAAEVRVHHLLSENVRGIKSRREEVVVSTVSQIDSTFLPNLGSHLDNVEVFSTTMEVIPTSR